MGCLKGNFKNEGMYKKYKLISNIVIQNKLSGYYTKELTGRKLNLTANIWRMCVIVFLPGIMQSNYTACGFHA